MSTINKNQCQSCGGNLVIDNNKQLFRCTSCGSTYDFDFFRAENLHEMGDTYLARGESKAAVDTYRLLLKKAPGDFLALRGLMLSAAHLRDMDGLVRLGEAKHFSYDTRMVREALDSASEEDTDYFEDLARIYYRMKELSDCNAEIRSLTSNHKRLGNTIKLEEQDTYNYKISGGYYSGKDPVPTFIGLWIFAVFLFLIMLCVIVPMFAAGDIGMGLIFGFFFVFFIALTAFVNMTEIYPEFKDEKDTKKYVGELRNESDLTNQQIIRLEAKAKELAEGIKASISEFVEKDRLIMAGSVKEKVSVPKTSKIKKHQCPSCGGSLRIDSDKQMYHCTFCGSSYDYEYFKEDQIHKAGETYLSRGEFMATAETYEFMLKKDPHDFLALRGLMLTAAHLTDVSELDQDNEDFSYDSEMVNQAIESSLEEDKEYFKELANVYSKRMELNGHLKEIEDLRKTKDSINTVVAHNNLSRNNYYISDKEGFKYSPKGQFLLFWGITVPPLLWTIGCGIGLINTLISDPDSVEAAFILFLPGFLICLGLIGYNYIFNYSKVRKLKKLDRDNAELYVASGQREEMIRDMENETEEIVKSLRRTIHDFVRKDRIIMREKKA